MAATIVLEIKDVNILSIQTGILPNFSLVINILVRKQQNWRVWS